MKHITVEQRYTIFVMLKAGFSQKDIAKTISKSESSISRELSRNSDIRNGVYKVELAQKKTDLRHCEKPKKVRLTIPVKSYIKNKLEAHYSPEQISGRAKVEKIECISTEAIYQYIWTDKKQGGELYKHLRTKIKKRKKRDAKKDRPRKAAC